MTAVGAKVKPYNGLPIKDARGKVLSVGVQVRLSIKVADKRNEIKRQEIERILDGYAPIVYGPSIGCTDSIEYTIQVISARPIKQKYYSASQKIEWIMHSLVKQMLEDDITEPSNSSWSISVVMVEKGEDKYRFRVDYRKVNKVSKCSGQVYIDH